MSLDGIRLMNKDMTGIMSKEEQAKLKKDNLGNKATSQPMSKNEVAKSKMKESCGDKKNKPVKESKSSGCCPEIYPWYIDEEGRNYTLNVTKEVEKKVQGKEGTRKGSAEDISAGQEEKKHELHITAPNPEKKVKEITVTHKFIEKNDDCDHIMMVENKKWKTGKELDTKGKFELDPDGNVIGAKRTSCEKINLSPEERKKENIRVTKLRQERQRKSIEDTGRVNPYDIRKEEFLYLENPNDNIKELNDFEVILMAIFDRQSISKDLSVYPMGSNKCKLQPKVHLYVYPDLAIEDGSLSLMYERARKTAIKDSTDITENRAKFEFSGTLKAHYGSRIIKLGSSLEVGGGSYTRQKGANPKKNIFSGVEKVLNVFNEAKDAQKEHNISQGRIAEFKHELFKINPGQTGVSLLVKGYELKEIPKKHTIDSKFNVNLALKFFSGASITVDCIELLIIYTSASNKFVSDILSSARDTLDAGVGTENIYVKGGAEVELSLHGGFAIKVDLKKEVEQSISFSKASISGSIGLSAKANVHAEGKFLFVTIEGSIGAAAASNANATVPSKLTLKGTLSSKEDKVLLGGGLDFTGLALYYVKSGSVSFTKVASSKGNGNNVFGAINTGVKQTNKIEEYDGKLTIFEEWPEEDNDAFIELTQFLS